MSIHTATLLQGLGFQIDRRLEELHTALPGRVESFDAAKQTVDVTPAVQSFALAEDGTRIAYTLPVLADIPLVFPGAGGYRETFPVTAGDTVLLVFTEASLDVWQAQGGIVDPQDRRRHHISDVVAIPGLHPNPKPWTGVATDAATWGHDGGPQVVARSAGLELGATAAAPPTDALVLGTTYRAAEDTFLQLFSSSAATIQTALTTAATALAAAATALAVPIVGGAMAATPLATVVSQLGVITAQVAALQAAIATYKSTGAGAYLSQKVKTA